MTENTESGIKHPALESLFRARVKVALSHEIRWEGKKAHGAKYKKIRIQYVEDEGDRWHVYAWDRQFWVKKDFCKVYFAVVDRYALDRGQLTFYGDDVLIVPLWYNLKGYPLSEAKFDKVYGEYKAQLEQEIEETQAELYMQFERTGKMEA